MKRVKQWRQGTPPEGALCEVWHLNQIRLARAYYRKSPDWPEWVEEGTGQRLAMITHWRLAE